MHTKDVPRGPWLHAALIAFATAGLLNAAPADASISGESSDKPWWEAEDKGAEKYAEGIKHVEELFAKILVDAQADGMAIVITTTINNDAAPKGHIQTNPDEAIDYERRAYALTQWNGAGEAAAGKRITVGGNYRALAIEHDLIKREDRGTQETRLNGSIGTAGGHFPVTYGRVMYMAYVVSPGKYTLDSFSYFHPNVELPNPVGKPVVSVSQLGNVQLKLASMDVYEKEKKWRSASYTTDVKSYNACTTVHVASGQCVATQTRSYEEERMTSPEGYYDDFKKVVVPSAEIVAKLKTPLAVLDVQPGEVVVVDGFFADAPSIDFDDKDCQRVATDTVQCELQSVRMVRLPTSARDFRQAMSAQAASSPSYANPGLVQLWDKAVDKPIELNAQPDTRKSYWGESYRLQSKAK